MLLVCMKVVVKDGRILVGDFLCIDKQGNLILGNTYQQVTRQDSLPFPDNCKALRLCSVHDYIILVFIAAMTVLFGSEASTHEGIVYVAQLV